METTGRTEVTQGRNMEEEKKKEEVRQPSLNVSA